MEQSDAGAEASVREAGRARETQLRAEDERLQSGASTTLSSCWAHYWCIVFSDENVQILPPPWKIVYVLESVLFSLHLQGIGVAPKKAKVEEAASHGEEEEEEEEEEES